MSGPTPAELTAADERLAEATRLIDEYRRRNGSDPDRSEPEGYFGSLRDAADQAFELLEEHEQSGSPEPDPAWCQGLRERAEKARRLAVGDEEVESQTKGNQAQEILDIGRQAELLATTAGDLLASFTVLRHRETWPIQSREFRGWLAAGFLDRHDKPPQPAAISAALPLLEHAARVSGEEIEDHVRIARLGDFIYIDVGDREWSALEIGPEGVGAPVQPSPIRFRRSRGQLPLPLPRPGGSVDLLRPYVRTGSDDDFKLVVGWLVGALMPGGPKPALWLHGHQGAAKSTATRCLRSLVDPNQVPSRDAPREARDLAITAKRSWVLAYDNLSALPDWLSDAFARLATGAGFGTRKLYEDDEEMLFLATRPVIANGIEELAVRGDLLDRAIVVELPPISESERRTEADLNRAFEADAPLIFEALLQGVSTSLRRIDEVQLERLPRMADFARAVEAAAPAFDWAPGEFLAAYERSRDRAVDVEIEASPIGSPLLALMADRDEWKGSASDLITALAEFAPERERHLKSWPKSARALHGGLKRLAEALKQRGVNIDRKHREGKAGDRVVRVWKVADTNVSADPPNVSADTSMCQPQTRIPTPNGGEADTSDTSDPGSICSSPESGEEEESAWEVGANVSEVSAEAEADCV